MVLPFILGVAILAVAGMFFFFGRSSEALGQRTAFLVMGGIMVLLLGAFMMSEGLELPIVDSISDAGAISYRVVENTEGSAAWLLFNSVFWFGAVLIVLSVALSAFQFRDSRRAARRDVLDWG